jgi:hypothetical protein
MPVNDLDTRLCEKYLLIGSELRVPWGNDDIINSLEQLLSEIYGFLYLF